MAEVSDLKIKLVGMEKEQSEYEEKQNKAEVSYFSLACYYFSPSRVYAVLSHSRSSGLKSARNRIFHACSTARVTYPMNSARSTIMHFWDAVSFPPSHYTSEVAVWLSSRQSPFEKHLLQWVFT